MTRRSLAAVLLTAFASLVAVTTTASAATPKIEDPGDPYQAVVDRTGHTGAVTVRASGFVPGELVNVMLCATTPARKPRFVLTLDCDVGTAPAPVLVDAKGIATFGASDHNHAFTPTYGTSPQGLFHCIAKGDPPPRDGNPVSTTCAIRVATNNFNRTDDETYTDVVYSHTGNGGKSSVPIVVVIGLGAGVLAGVLIVVLRHRPQSASDR